MNWVLMVFLKVVYYLGALAIGVGIGCFIRFIRTSEKWNYHCHAPLGSIKIRHRRSLSCEAADRWAQETQRALDFALQFNLVAVPEFLFSLETHIPNEEFGSAWGDFTERPLRIRLALMRELECRELAENVVHEVSHLIWFLLGKSFVCFGPHRFRSHEMMARGFERLYVRTYYGD